MKAIVFLSIFCSSAFAADFSKQIWSLKDDHYLFNLESKSQILISESCLNENTNLENSKCEAAQAFKYKSSLDVDSKEFAGGKNPGAVACTIGLKKKIVILKDSKDNENSFCIFDDQSMISAINLHILLKD